MPKTELLIGDLAPELRLGEILKGEHVTHFLPGRIYLVECWATWCGPCLETIPHLTRLQAAHPDVTVIGIAVHESDVAEVRAFVDGKGAEMGYTVAMDDRGDGEDGWMPRAWLGPSYQAGIPAAFLVDREGRVAWVGHPRSVDEVLSQILAGTFDLPAAAQSYRDYLSKGMVRESTALSRELDRCFGVDDRAGALQAMDLAFAAHPRLETLRGIDKLLWLLQGDCDAAIAYSHRLADEVSPNDAVLLMAAGHVMVEAAEASSTAPEAKSLATRALEMLQAASERGMDGGDERRAFHDMQLSWYLARALIAVGRSAEARDHAQAALDAALALGGLRDVFLDRLRDLVQSCPTQPQAAKTSEAVVVCEGDTCRIVA